MTEADWQAAGDPGKMLAFLRGSVSDRKLRLFACACVRRVSRLLVHAQSRRALEVAERFADGEATARELRTAEKRASGVTDELYTGEWEPIHGAYNYAATAAWWLGNSDTPFDAEYVTSKVYGASVNDPDDPEEEPERQADLLRCVVGNPFRPVNFAPAWLTSTVIALATGIYADRAFDRLPILADALEEAGCDDPTVLAHCRTDGPHVRGCWVVDGVLGKT